MAALPLADLKARAEGDPVLARFGKGFDCALVIGDGDRDWLVEIEKGVVAKVTPGPLLSPRSDLFIRAAANTWAQFLKAVPAPGYHDLFAMLRWRRVSIEGDMKLMTAYLFYIKRLFALLRSAEARP